MDIKRVNLNLLVHFNTLYESRSVSIAAKRSFITQTAMSHHLRKLRDIFDDKLFIKRSTGIRPTKKAIELAPQISNLVTSASNIFDFKDFVPELHSVNFNMALTAFGEHIILPKLCYYLKKNAPHITLNTTAISTSNPLEDLLEDQTDLAIAPGFVSESENIISEKILLDKAVCICRKGLYKPDEFNIESFLKADHVDLLLSDSASKFLRQRIDFFRNRSVRYKVTNIMTGIEIIEKLDCLMSIPLSIARKMEKNYKLDILPFPTNQTFYMKCFYHKRLSEYKPLLWIIKTLKEL